MNLNNINKEESDKILEDFLSELLSKQAATCITTCVSSGKLITSMLSDKSQKISARLSRWI